MKEKRLAGAALLPHHHICHWYHHGLSSDLDGYELL